MNQTAPAKLSRLLLYLSFGLSALFVVLARIYTISCSDILIMYTAWPEVIEILINILECVIYGIAYSFLIYAAYRFPEVGIAKFVWIYAASVLFKYISNYIVTWMTDAGMSADYLVENLTYILIYAAMELAQMGLVLLIVWRTMKGYHAFVARQAKIAANLPGAEVNMRTYAFPFSKVISLQNPLQKCAFWSGVIIAAFKILSRLIYDISYGLPSSIVDGFWMVIYYLLDMFVGFAVCLLITYLMMYFDSREQKKA